MMERKKLLGAVHDARDGLICADSQLAVAQQKLIGCDTRSLPAILSVARGAIEGVIDELEAMIGTIAGES